MSKHNGTGSWIIALWIVGGFLAAVHVSGTAYGASYTIGPDGKKSSRISDESVPVVDTSSFPKRPRRLEIGPPFIGSGPLPLGIELPGGLVVNPSLLIYGSYRTAIQTYKNPRSPLGNETFSEWANRLDIFANFQISYVNRILLGLQPLHDRGREVGEGPPVFTSYNFEPAMSPTGDEDFQDEFNTEITTLFFEGDLGELFPGADFYDFGSMDLGISIGRQPLFIQEGLLIFDTIDSIGIIRNNILPRGGSNFQATFLYGWNEINRADNLDPDNLSMYALFLAADYPENTYALNLIYVAASEGPEIPNPAAAPDPADPTAPIDPTAPATVEADTSDGFHWGINATQRIGHYNTAFHILGSHALDGTPPVLPGASSPAVGDGYLIFVETSTTPPWTQDNIWLNLYLGIDDYTPAARDPTVGGPLGRAGLLYAAQGLGRYLLGISNQGRSVAGFALGYQKFLGNHRKQLVFELGGRQGTESDGETVAALLVRYQQGIGQHAVWELSGFGATIDDDNEMLDDSGYGLRTEYRYNF